MDALARRPDNGLLAQIKLCLRRFRPWYRPRWFGSMTNIPNRYLLDASWRPGQWRIDGLWLEFRLGNTLWIRPRSTLWTSTDGIMRSDRPGQTLSLSRPVIRVNTVSFCPICKICYHKGLTRLRTWCHLWKFILHRKSIPAAQSYIRIARAFGPVRLWSSKHYTDP